MPRRSWAAITTIPMVPVPPTGIRTSAGLKTAAVARVTGAGLAAVAPAPPLTAAGAPTGGVAPRGADAGGGAGAPRPPLTAAVAPTGVVSLGSADADEETAPVGPPGDGSGDGLGVRT